MKKPDNIDSLTWDCIPNRLMKTMKPYDNGLMEATGRIYEALCNIPRGDLTQYQSGIIRNAIKNAYASWVKACENIENDPEQGPKGFRSIRDQWHSELLSF